jgi:hypothetical protein
MLSTRMMAAALTGLEHGWRSRQTARCEHVAELDVRSADTEKLRQRRSQLLRLRKRNDSAHGTPHSSFKRHGD